MFSATKSSAGPYPISNARNKFVQGQNENDQKLFNRSFDTASKLLNKSGKLKQTKLCLNKSWTTKKPEHDNNENFFQLPTKSNVQLTEVQNCAEVLPCATHARQRHDAAGFKVKSDVSKGASNPLSMNGRNSLAITGRVDFCLKMHRKHSEVNAIWDVYGGYSAGTIEHIAAVKSFLLRPFEWGLMFLPNSERKIFIEMAKQCQLLKKFLGKQRFEFILLLRNDSGGPVLQGIYYDFCNKLACIDVGCHVRIVGRFIGDNRLQTFKLQQVKDKIVEEDFTRIQNVTSFALLQNEIYANTGEVLKNI